MVHTLEKLEHPGIEVPVGVGEDAHRECGGGSRRKGFVVSHRREASLA
jgi:hypothetical protein